MILRGTLKAGESSTQLRGGNKFVRCEYVKGTMGGKSPFFVLHSMKYGKKYIIFMRKTSGGALTGTELFPRNAISLTWSKNGALTCRWSLLAKKYKKRKS